ncbi:MAG: hypothetical protein J6T70_06390 [Bacteroidales bacterium]|nr:hypothetical protein [Bacteroidales bacterium]
MKFSKLLWLISLSAAVTLNFTSCKDDEEEPKKEDPQNPVNQEQEQPQDPNTALVKITVLNEENEPQKATVRMRKEGESKDLTYEDTDENGVAKFVINANDLEGTYKKTFDFIIDDKDEILTIDGKNFISLVKGNKKSVTLIAGDSKSETLTIKEFRAEEKVEVENPTIKVNPNGTISINMNITTNSTIKKMLVVDKDGKIWYDFQEQNESGRGLNKTIANDRRNYNIKDITLSLSTNELPVDYYRITVTTSTGEKASLPIAEEVEYKIGAAKSKIGSYLSISNNKTLLFAEAKEVGCEVIAQSDESGINVVGLIKGTNAKSSDVAVHSGKVAFFQNGSAVATIKEGGVIVTESGVIFRIKQINNTTSGEATIEGVTIKKGLESIQSVDISRVLNW